MSEVQEKTPEKKEEAKILTMADVLPEKPEFYLETKKKTYTLRIANIQDGVAFGKMFGTPEALMEVFNKMEWAKMCKIAYRLMIDKSDFMAEEREIINDDGVKEKIFVTGPEMLLESIKGVVEATKVLGACNVAIALGEPIMGEYLKKEMKKKVETFGKKRTGQPSSTSSQANTGTPQNSSGS